MENLLRKRWVQILIIFAVIGVIASFILRLITPQLLTVPASDFINSNTQWQSVSFENIVFEGLPPQIPTTLPLATVSPSQTTLDYVLGQLIATYGLEQVIGDESFWRGPTHSLAYDSFADEYLLYAASIPEEARLTDPSRAIDAAAAFVRGTFPNLALAPLRSDVVYLHGLDELDAVSAAEAGAVEVPFAYTINNIPVFLEHRRTAPITLIVNNQYEVQKVVFQPHFLDFVLTQQQTNTIDLTAALTNVNEKNQASIVSAFEPETGLFSLDQARSGVLRSVQLEYRADLENSIAYPFYRFTGELTNQSGQTINAQIITPAVEVRE